MNTTEFDTTWFNLSEADMGRIRAHFRIRWRERRARWFPWLARKREINVFTTWEDAYSRVSDIRRRGGRKVNVSFDYDF